MRIWFLSVALWWLTKSLACAEDATAREQFEIGVAAAEDNRWSDAVAHLEASLAHTDKAATRYNLVLAHERLGHALDVVRHALAFLATHDASDRSDARAKVQELLAQAKTRLAVLDAGELVSGTVLFVDGGPPLAREGTHVYVGPGIHRIEVRVPGRPPEVNEQTLTAGEVRLLPPPSAPQLAASQVVRTSPQEPAKSRSDAAGATSLRQRRAVWALAGAGAGALVASVSCLGLSYTRADSLHERGVEGTKRSGYLGAADRYQHSLDAVLPLAFAAGAAIGIAVGLSERSARGGNLTSSVLSSVLAAGLLAGGGYLLGREPDRVIATTELERPSRQLGGVLVAAGVPLVVYAVGAFLLKRRSSVRAQSALVAPFVSW